MEELFLPRTEFENYEDFFKNYKINKIREKMRQVMDIIKDYENNCIFK